MKIMGLIVAAGQSSRMGGELPKPYMKLAGRSVLRWSLKTLIAHPRIENVQVVINPDHWDHYDSATQGVHALPPIAGGNTRQESVLNGLEALVGDKPDAVLIHDAARPFVSKALIERLAEGLGQAQGVVPVLPVFDTLKRVHDGVVETTVDRTALYQVQTPQAFHFLPLLEAHRKAAGKELTDDAAVAELAGMKIAAVEGEADNFKVTTQADWSRAERKVMQYSETRTGSGYDVHALIPARDGHITLCGVRIPHSHTLEGHSDADVGLHALVDALLGAMAEGDIGLHFPPSDQKWKGADSTQFLAYAGQLLRQRGGQAVHVDVTLICEAPKIQPHREAMRARIAAIMELPVERVSVKATTTEGLGFTGRREGIAAQALATIRLPS